MGANGARIGAGQKGKGPIEGLSGEMEHQMANAAALIFRDHIEAERGHAGAKGKEREPLQREARPSPPAKALG